MSEEAQRVKEEAEKHFDALNQRLRRYREENLELRDKFAEEKTYKLSHLLITLSIAILAAMSFLFTQEGLEPLSRQLSITLIFPVIIVGLELRYLYRVVEINREISSKRAEAITKLLKEDARAAFEKAGQAQTFAELAQIAGGFDEKEKEVFNEVLEYTKREEKKIEPLRNWTWIFLFLTLVSIFGIILSESGVLAWLGKSHCFLSDSKLRHHWLPRLNRFGF